MMNAENIHLSPTLLVPTPVSAGSSTPTTPVPPHSPSPAQSPQPTSPNVISPCAACKILRRRCVDKCILAPYFPPTDPYKFTIAHRVFGAANIIKLLQELPESQRADVVSSMVYEANARLRDPVYGCAGAICRLQKQINELQAELAKAQAEAVNIQCQNSNLLALICMEMAHIQGDMASPPATNCNIDIAMQQPQQQYMIDPSFFPDDSSFDSGLEMLLA